MFTELLDRFHLLNHFKEYPRSYRLKKNGDFWYFDTREGIEIGPFTDRADAQYASHHFCEKVEWPDKEELLAFKDGCEIHAGIKH